jgi:hypothetical protein
MANNVVICGDIVKDAMTNLDWAWHHFWWWRAWVVWPSNYVNNSDDVGGSVTDSGCVRNIVDDIVPKWSSLAMLSTMKTLSIMVWLTRMEPSDAVNGGMPKWSSLVVLLAIVWPSGHWGTPKDGKRHRGTSSNTARWTKTSLETKWCHETSNDDERHHRMLSDFTWRQEMLWDAKWHRSISSEFVWHRVTPCNAKWHWKTSSDVVGMSTDRCPAKSMM